MPLVGVAGPFRGIIVPRIPGAAKPPGKLQTLAVTNALGSMGPKAAGARSAFVREFADGLSDFLNGFSEHFDGIVRARWDRRDAAWAAARGGGA